MDRRKKNKTTGNGHCMINLCVVTKASMEGWEGPMESGKEGCWEARLSIALAFCTFRNCTYIHSIHHRPKTGDVGSKVLFAIEYQRCHLFLISFHFNIIESTAMPPLRHKPIYIISKNPNPLFLAPPPTGSAPYLLPFPSRLAPASMLISHITSPHT